MPQIIAVVGKSGSGKTTLLVKLISELKKRGYSIGTVKHTHHPVEGDREGKDSALHKQAGADTVILASSRQIFMQKDADGDDPEKLKIYFQDRDLLLCEGYKNADCPKIEIFRKDSGKSPLYPDARYSNFTALVSDADIAADMPVFGLEDISEISDFIEKNYILTKKGG
ncbi:MAG: molybdopterin-guanine dinucleotide biosynthesis protein B [Desulfococcaceae bacterium]|jgi:molybdopterin-guanine dinucleotide biosynthesis protein MobB|nr:molybdopterin-guanine dinucleotide biosynthesis protein B [Desulfococcaceae bacterium]